MKKTGIIKKFEDFEFHHKFFAFILVMCLTILIIRFIVFIHNPTPILFNFELHHFDLGFLLLIICSLSLLFGNIKYYLNLFFTAIAFGLVLDDFWFIRSNILDPGLNESAVYSSTFSMVVVFVIITLLFIFLLNYFKDKSLNKSKIR